MARWFRISSRFRNQCGEVSTCLMSRGRQSEVSVKHSSRQMVGRRGAVVHNAFFVCQLVLMVNCCHKTWIRSAIVSSVLGRGAVGATSPCLSVPRRRSTTRRCGLFALYVSLTLPLLPSSQNVHDSYGWWLAIRVICNSLNDQRDTENGLAWQEKISWKGIEDFFFCPAILRQQRVTRNPQISISARKKGRKIMYNPFHRILFRNVAISPRKTNFFFQNLVCKVSQIAGDILGWG